ncbi:MAG: RluA family pseudouridine synthase [Verrucomicrobiales bacterium]|nr:RluA family pseudouridine synthase [Verrucomicrobiales bacterium]
MRTRRILAFARHLPSAGFEKSLWPGAALPPQCRVPEYHLDQPEDAVGRLDRYLQARLPDLSRARIQDLIRQGHITLNGQPTKPGAPLKLGQRISVTIPEPTSVEVVAQDIPLDILHEDEDILVLNKPSGLVVHPAAGNPDGTLVNALLHHCDDLSGIGGEARPGIVHRLDKDTSGCMVIAKHDRAHRQLTQAFSDRRIRKIYLAAVQGMPTETQGRLEGRIGRHPVDRKRMTLLYDGSGKEAVTEWELVGSHRGTALIRCRLLTGRTHQIRVHMKEGLRLPILGDPLYAQPSRQPLAVPRLMLHAWRLAFNHPLSERPLAFEAPPPAVFAPWLDGASLQD